MQCNFAFGIVYVDGFPFGLHIVPSILHVFVKTVRGSDIAHWLAMYLVAVISEFAVRGIIKHESANSWAIQCAIHTPICEVRHVKSAFIFCGHVWWKDYPLLVCVGAIPPSLTVIKFPISIAVTKTTGLIACGYSDIAVFVMFFSQFIEFRIRWSVFAAVLCVHPLAMLTCCGCCGCCGGGDRG